ncbi:MAG: hypothetical protein LIO56_05925 [Lachnospiraceae bacterium]|nr:hypothetical protein [Lachnospiraceae bacterium]
MDTIGYMGIVGSFSEVAARELVKEQDMTDVRLEPMVCSQNILDALRSGEAAYGVLGVTNTTAGPVAEFEQAFSGVDYEVLAKYILPVHHCIFLYPGMQVGDIREIASHPQAFGQTRHYRANNHPAWKEHAVSDTALAAEWLAQGTLPPTTAVICSRQAGLARNLDLIAENVEDSPDNKTTFWLLKLK